MTNWEPSIDHFAYPDSVGNFIMYTHPANSMPVHCVKNISYDVQLDDGVGDHCRGIVSKLYASVKVSGYLAYPKF